VSSLLLTSQAHTHGWLLVMVPVDCLLEALTQRDRRLVVECSLDSCNIRFTMTDVSVSALCVNNIGIGIGDINDRLGEFTNTNTGSSADVVRLPSVVGRCSPEIRLDDIVDEDEVTSLLAITVNRERIVVYCLLTEDTDNAAVVASSLAWSEDIEISKCRGLEVIEVVILLGIVIDREFVKPAGRGRCFGVGFFDWDLFGMAIDGCARGQDDSGILSTGSLEDVKSGADVDVVTLLWGLNRF